MSSSVINELEKITLSLIASSTCQKYYTSIIKIISS